MNVFVRWHFVLPTDKERLLTCISKISPPPNCNLLLHLIGKSEIFCLFAAAVVASLNLMNYRSSSTKETEIQL